MKICLLVNSCVTNHKNVRIHHLVLVIAAIKNFLTTYYWLKLGWWGWLVRMRLTWKNSQKTLGKSKRLLKHCHYWELQVRHSLEGPWGGGEIHSQAEAASKYWSIFWCTKSLLCRLLIMSPVVHAELVLYTTVVN